MPLSSVCFTYKHCCSQSVATTAHCFLSTSLSAGPNRVWCPPMRIQYSNTYSRIPVTGLGSHYILVRVLLLS